MKHHVIPAMEDNPNHIILHTGTNDIPSEKSAEQISDEIISLAISLRTPQNTVYVSGITDRGDNLNQKVMSVNEIILLRKCQERNIAFIKHEINSKVHLNRSKLHLNKKGTAIILKNFIDMLNKNIS